MKIELYRGGVDFIINEFLKQQAEHIRELALYADHINGEVALNMYADHLEETLKGLQNDDY